MTIQLRSETAAVTRKNGSSLSSQVKQWWCAVVPIVLPLVVLASMVFALRFGASSPYHHLKTTMQKSKEINGRPLWLTMDNLTVHDKIGDTSHGVGVGSSPGFPHESDWLLATTDYHKDSVYQKNQQLIPKQLHKVFLTSHGDFTQQFYDMMANKTIQNMTGPPEEISAFHGHIGVGKYSTQITRSEAFAGKADLFRYLVLYREGGFYSDWKQECMVDGLLDRLSADNVTFIASTDSGLPARMHSTQNSFLGATPGHPILAKAIEIILRNMQGRSDVNKTKLDHDSAYEMTSTIPLGKAFRAVNPSIGTPGGARLLDFKAQYGLRFFLGDEIVIVHKCYNCGSDQNWSDGNNYLHKYEIGEFFCPDGPSLFHD